MNYDNLLYYSYEAIEKKANSLGFSFDSILDYEGYKFYCPEWIFEISKENDRYKIVCSSEYSRIELTDNEISHLYEKSMLEVVRQVFLSSKNISDVYFIFMLFHLWQNYIQFTALYDSDSFGISQIKAGKTILTWDNREKEFSVTKISIFSRSKRYDMTRIIDIVKSIFSIMFSKEAKTGYRSRILNAEQNGEMTFLYEELSPEFKKELKDEEVKLAKKQLAKNYQGFKMEINSRWGHIFYIRNKKVIVTDYERGFGNIIILTRAALGKWTFPDDRLLSEAETAEMEKDLKDFEEKEKVIVKF